MRSIADSLTAAQTARRDELLDLLRGYSWLRWHHYSGPDRERQRNETDLIWNELAAIVHELMGVPRLISEGDLVEERAELSRNDLKHLRDVPVRALAPSAMRLDLHQQALAVVAAGAASSAPRFSTYGYIEKHFKVAQA